MKSTGPRKNRLGTLSLIVSSLSFVVVAFVCKDILAPYDFFGINLQKFLEATFEAAVVGGCADWYAVVALFRHPFGIPIPHTRILPSKKLEIAEGVKDMVKTFLNPRSMAEMIQDKHLGLMIFSFIDRGREKGIFSEIVTRLTPIFIYELRNRAMLGPIISPMARYLEENVDYTKLTASVLKFMKKDGLDERLLDFATDQVVYFITHEKAFIAKRLVNTVMHLNGQGMAGKIKMWFVKKLMNEKETEGLIEQMLPIIKAEMSATGDAGTIRRSLQSMLNAYIHNLDHDEELKKVMNFHIRKIIQNMNLEEVLRIVNSWVADYLEKELALGEDGRFMSGRTMFAEIISEVRNNQLVLDELDTMLKNIIKVIIDSQVIVAELGSIAQKEVLRMSDDHLVEFIEDKVGNDLQYIRLNGAVLGGIVGALLYCFKALLL